MDIDDDDQPAVGIITATYKHYKGKMRRQLRCSINTSEREAHTVGPYLSFFRLRYQIAMKHNMAMRKFIYRTWLVLRSRIYQELWSTSIGSVACSQMLHLQ